MRVLVTGASGFMGRAVLARASGEGRHSVRAALRASSVRPVIAGSQEVIVGDHDERTDWGAALEGIDVVVHTAARVHVMHEVASDPLAEFRRVNTAGTLNLAQQAEAARVRRLVFISSIKVNGERTEPGHPYTADQMPTPVDPYGQSKLEAEQGLLQIAARGRMDVTIVRPVLVYGPGVRGNFLTLMRWLQKGLPLPLGGIRNLRSLVGLGNVADLIVRCLEHRAAANRVFLVSDGEDLATPELLRRVAAALGKQARLLPIPAGVLQNAARMLGAADVAQRLCDSLQVDISATCRLLDWRPPVSVDEELRRTAAAFLAARVS